MTNKMGFPQLREQAIALRRAGKSRAEIKDILGIGSNETLGKALRGEPPPEWTLRARAKDDLHAKARELRAQGRTYDEIATELGVSKGSVSLWVRDLPRPGRLSYAESRRRNAEATAAYFAARRTVREARRRGQARERRRAEIGTLSDREILDRRVNRILVRGREEQAVSSAGDRVDLHQQRSQARSRSSSGSWPLPGVDRDRLICRAAHSRKRGRRCSTAVLAGRDRPAR